MLDDRGPIPQAAERLSDLHKSGIDDVTKLAGQGTQHSDSNRQDPSDPMASMQTNARGVA